MFCVVVAGRPAQTEFIAISPTQFTLALVQPDAINHLALFMTAPFQEGYGASIHILWPSTTIWRLLGTLSNEKPSAIYKVKRTDASQDDLMIDDTATATLGISIEPLSAIMQSAVDSGAMQVTLARGDTLMSTSNTNLSGIDVVDKMIESLTNYCLGFVGPLPFGGSSFTSSLANTYIPLKDWAATTKRKIANDASLFNKP